MPRDIRVFVDFLQDDLPEKLPEKPVGRYPQTIVLNADQSHHLLNVVRIKAGQQVVVVEKKSGEVFSAAAKKLDDPLVLEILERGVEKQAPSFVRNVCIPLLKGGRTDWAVEKATEIGVHSIVVWQAGRSVRKSGDADYQRIERWRKVSEQAARQSHRSKLPEIAFAPSLEDVLGLLRADNVIKSSSYWLSLDPAAALLSNALEQAQPEVSLLIGPEGDFSGEELKLLAASDWKAASLGPWVLRSETAVIAALALAQGIGLKRRQTGVGGE